MRKITRDVANAFNYDISFSSGNTAVITTDRLTKLILHENIIALKQRGSKEAEITNAGYFTNVTKDRLNSINGVDIKQVKGVWYLNGKEWDGKWITIKLR